MARKPPHFTKPPLFAAIPAGSLLNLNILSAMVNRFSFHPLASKTVVVALSFFWNSAGKFQFAFKVEKVPKSRESGPGLSLRS